MSYDKTNDFKQIQADVLTIDTADNENIANLKKLKTDNKVITKAINALNEQLGNAQTSASDAVQRVVLLENEVAELEQANTQQAALITLLQTELAELKESTGKQNNNANESSENGGNENNGVNNNFQAEHVYGMVLVQEGNKSGTWARINKNYETVEFNPEHGTWAGMHTVMNDTYGEFVEIPVTYVKTETLADGPYAGKNCWWTADGPVDGFHVHPAFIGQDGQPHPLQVAAYDASNKDGVPFSENSVSKDYWRNVSYNDVHAKGWMADGVRPYNIYDHHFLARLMLTEFGTPDIQTQIVDGIEWTGANRIVYHGMYDLFGHVDQIRKWHWLDGLTTLNGTYQVLAADGSLSMVETGVACQTDPVYPINCRIDKVNGINFGDLFIANMANNIENSGSFADKQIFHSGCAFNVYWNTSAVEGAFYLHYNGPSYSNSDICWRISRCAN